MTKRHILIAVIGCGWFTAAAAQAQEAAPAGRSHAGVEITPYVSLGSSATSGIGVGDSYADAPLFSRIVIKVLLRDIYADKAIGEHLVRMSDLEWTIIQPAQLTNGPLTRRYRAGEDLKQHGMPTVSRADLADFLLTQVDDRTYVRKTVRLGY